MNAALLAWSVALFVWTFGGFLVCAITERPKTFVSGTGACLATAAFLAALCVMIASGELA